MTDQERLQEIKEFAERQRRWNTRVDDGWVPSISGEYRHEDIIWLIEQAENAQELDALLNRACDDITYLRKARDRHKQALEFYGDEENYEAVFIPVTQIFDCEPVLNDRGHKARQALEGESE